MSLLIGYLGNSRLVIYYDNRMQNFLLKNVKLVRIIKYVSITRISPKMY